MVIIMKRLQSITLVMMMCMLLVYAGVLQKNNLTEIEDKNPMILAETVQIDTSSERYLEEERQAEAAVTVEVLESEDSFLQTLPDDMGMEISCPAEDAMNQQNGIVMNQDSSTVINQQNLIMDSVVPMDELYTDASVDTFFEDAIFVGDSVTVGLSNYYSHLKGRVFTDTTQFLAQVGCSAKMCVSSNPTVKYQKYMPDYGGRLCKVEDGIALSGAKKVFIDYGLNDLTGCTPDEFLKNFSTLISRIQEKNPDVQIYVISTTYVVDDAQTGLLTNKNIRKSNENIKEYCRENGFGFINIADYIADGNGGLNTKYSSDQYVHQNMKSYEVWVKVLRHYAYLQMSAA